MKENISYLFQRILFTLLRKTTANWVWKDKQSKVGKYTYIGPRSAITKASIGNYCSIGSGVIIGPGEHQSSMLSTSAIFYKKDVYGKLTLEDCIVENDVWIGANAIILRGITIGTGSIIGAGAIVTKSIPPYSVAVGIPAKVIRNRFNNKQIELLLKSEWWTLEPLEAEKLLISLENEFKNHV